MAGDTGKGFGWGRAVLIAGLMALVYVLSFGPADYAMKRTGQGLKLVMTVYAPVVWLHDHTPLAGPLEWYEKAWCPR